MLTPEQRLVFIDNDRTELIAPHGITPKSQRQRNLIQFGSRLPVELDDSKLVERFLSIYYECLPQFTQEKDALFAIIQRRREFILQNEHPKRIDQLGIRN